MIVKQNLEYNSKNNIPISLAYFNFLFKKINITNKEQFFKGFLAFVLNIISTYENSENVNLIHAIKEEQIEQLTKDIINNYNISLEFLGQNL